MVKAIPTLTKWISEDPAAVSKPVRKRREGLRFQLVFSNSRVLVLKTPTDCKEEHRGCGHEEGERKDGHNNPDATP